MARWLNIGSAVIGTLLNVKGVRQTKEGIELNQTQFKQSQLLSYSASVNEYQNKADDDEYEQKNNEIQTIMLLSSLFMQGSFTILSIQYNSRIFNCCLSISISLLFISVLAGLSTIQRMSIFMSGRARERNRRLQDLRDNLMNDTAPPSSHLLQINPSIQHTHINTFHEWFLYKCNFMCCIHIYCFKSGIVMLIITMIVLKFNMYLFIIPMIVSILVYILLEYTDSREKEIQWDV
jgi:hypothetical protein